MNCHDIDAILDNGGARHLDDAARSNVDAHLAECDRCAGVWSAQALIASQPVPKLSSELLDDTRQYIARCDKLESERRPIWRWLPFAGVASAASLVTAVLVVALVGMGTAEPARPSFAERLPEFSLTSIGGDPLAIGSWPGKPMVINFWATWCAPCRREIPLLIEFQSENPTVQVVGIAVDNFDVVEEFDAEIRFNYPIMIGGDDAIDAAAAFGVEAFAIPFTVFVDSNRNLLGIHKGEIDAARMVSYAVLINDVEANRIDVETARALLAEVP